MGCDEGMKLAGLNESLLFRIVYLYCKQINIEIHAGMRLLVYQYEIITDNRLIIMRSLLTSSGLLQYVGGLPSS